MRRERGQAVDVLRVAVARRRDLREVEQVETDVVADAGVRERQVEPRLEERSRVRGVSRASIVRLEARAELTENRATLPGTPSASVGSTMPRYAVRLHERPAPALSPTTTMFSGANAHSRTRYSQAAKPSCSAPGNAHSAWSACRYWTPSRRVLEDEARSSAYGNGPSREVPLLAKKGSRTWSVSAERLEGRRGARTRSRLRCAKSQASASQREMLRQKEARVRTHLRQSRGWLARRGRPCRSQQSCRTRARRPSSTATSPRRPCARPA